MKSHGRSEGAFERIRPPGDCPAHGERTPDGKCFEGPGPNQITGRGGYPTFDRQIGIDIERHPEVAPVPSIRLHLALSYWADRKLNTLTDADDVVGITRQINGGTNRLADRKAYLAKIKGWLL